MCPTQKRFFCCIWKFVHQIHQNSQIFITKLGVFFICWNSNVVVICEFWPSIGSFRTFLMIHTDGFLLVFVPLNLPDVTLLWQRRQGLTPASSLYPFGIRCVNQEVLQPLPQLCQFGPDHFLFLHHGVTTRRSAGGFCRIARWWYNWPLRIWVQRFSEYPPKALLEFVPNTVAMATLEEGTGQTANQHLWFANKNTDFITSQNQHPVPAVSFDVTNHVVWWWWHHTRCQISKTFWCDVKSFVLLSFTRQHAKKNKTETLSWFLFYEGSSATSLDHLDDSRTLFSLFLNL